MRITGWILVLIGAAAAAFLVYEAVTIPFLHGAGLAQAGFELFVFSVVLGVPGLIASVLGTLLVRRHALMGAPAPHRFPIASTMITALTVFAIIGAFVFSLMMRTYGFFWR